MQYRRRQIYFLFFVRMFLILTGTGFLFKEEINIAAVVKIAMAVIII